MGEELQTQVLEETVIFIPSHLTKGLVASGISLVASGVAVTFGLYALWEFKQVKAEEILAMMGKY